MPSSLAASYDALIFNPLSPNLSEFSTLIIFRARLQMPGAPVVTPARVTINDAGLISGLPQFANAISALLAVSTELKSLHSAQLSYFVENNKYSKDVSKIGFVPSAALRSYGSLTIEVTSSGYVAIFRGLGAPFVKTIANGTERNLIVKIDQSGTITRSEE